jgi:hypothetical protein
MKAPEHERAELLGEVVRRATYELNAPIDRIEVIGDAERVDCWAGSRQVSLAVDYAQGGQYEFDGRDDQPTLGRFRPTVGSGSWNVWVVPRPEAPQGVIARILARFWKRRGSTNGKVT